MMEHVRVCREGKAETSRRNDYPSYSRRKWISPKPNHTTGLFKNAQRRDKRQAQPLLPLLGVRSSKLLDRSVDHGCLKVEKGPPSRGGPIKNRNFAKVRLFPVQSLIAANSGHEIISWSRAE
jgi:hypothetical protein